MQAKRLPQCWCMVSTQWELEYYSLTKVWRSASTGLLFLTNLKQQLSPQGLWGGGRGCVVPLEMGLCRQSGSPPPWAAYPGRPPMRLECGLKGRRTASGCWEWSRASPSAVLYPLQKSQIDRSEHCVSTQLKLLAYVLSVEPPCWFTTPVTQDF